MVGLNPLQNAKPRQEIPNEAPQYFSTFFEQHAKPPPVTIWQPPQVDLPRRSKAPTHRPRSPPQIPTAGTWTRPSIFDPKPQPKGLFQPKQKKSVDEMMWLGSVAGFALPEPAPPVEQRSLRSKLVRKPEQIPSQASFATGPKATEAKSRKEGEARARERRLEEWATKKRPHASDKRNDEPHGMVIEIAQPFESRLRTRKKVYTPLPQEEEAARISNRPNQIHRPYMPATDDQGGYTPNKPFLPQPVENLRHIPRPLLKRLKSQEEETLWMGLPQPVESTRRSNRKSPLIKMQSVTEMDSDKETAEADKAAILPQPVESSRRSNRPTPKSTVILPEPIESSRRSNRPRKEILPEPVESTRRSSRTVRKDDLPQPVESTRRSNRLATPKECPPRPAATSSNENLPQPIESSKRSNRSKDGLPVPIESTRRTSERRKEPPGPIELPVPVEITKKSNRPTPTFVQAGGPPTPTTSFFGPEILPQPVESTRRSHRPITARPLVLQPIECSLRSSRMRIPLTQMHTELPQPVSVSRWTSRAPGLRGDNPLPTSPGAYSFPRPGEKRRKMQQKFGSPAPDHVWHLHEPIDSTPSSPVDSPETSPSTSKCPSLSSSPTSTVTSTAWDVPVRRNHPRKESLDEGFTDYVERKLNRQKIEAEDKSGEGCEYPFPIAEGLDADHIGLGIRTRSSETIRPKLLRTIDSEPAISIRIPAGPSEDDYPSICHSPKFEAFRRPLSAPSDLNLDNNDNQDSSKPHHQVLPNAPEMWQPLGLSVIAPCTSVHAFTPADSLASSTIRQNNGNSPSKLLNLANGNGPPTVPQRMWGRQPAGPSPGYTVASRPPAKRRENNGTKEITPEFIDEVYRYLSLQYDNVAAQFDPELAEYTGTTIAAVKKDRKAALSKYCEKWVTEHPDFEAGEDRKAGFW